MGIFLAGSAVGQEDEEGRELGGRGRGRGRGTGRGRTMIDRTVADGVERERERRGRLFQKVGKARGKATSALWARIPGISKALKWPVPPPLRLI